MVLYFCEIVGLLLLYLPLLPSNMVMTINIDVCQKGLEKFIKDQAVSSDLAVHYLLKYGQHISNKSCQGLTGIVHVCEFPKFI